MKNCLVYILLGLTTSLVSFGQDRTTTNAGISFNGGFTNLGGGIGLHYSIGEDIRHYLISLEINTIKHPQEIFVESAYGNDLGRKFIFRKLNYFAVLSPTFGIQQNLIPSSSTNMISVRGGVKIGPAIGMLSPYLLELYRPNQGSNDNRVVEAYNPDKHTYNQILGRARLFTTDLNIQTRIGLSLKAFAMLDFARNQKYIQGISLGLNADIFANPIPIMAELDKLQNQRIFVAGLIGLMIGNRW